MSYYSLEPPVSKALEWQPSPLLVLPNSPRQFRNFCEVLAKCFRREMGFDFVQFFAVETMPASGRSPYEAYLFHETARDLLSADEKIKHRCFGACCFRWREWIDADIAPGWSLQWVWFHPYFRRRGYLSMAWAKFEERYGNFYIERPLSAGMEKFLAKHRCESRMI